LILIANKFKEEVKSKYQFITQNPKIYPIIAQGIRKCNFDNYPYPILYNANDENIEILAFAHFKRKPNYWKNRK
jgi:toxin ParE1/3/4